MYLLLVVAAVIVAGAVVMLRSSPPEPLNAPPGMTPEEALRLQGLVLEKLRDRLPAWTLETREDDPLRLALKDTTSEREIQLDLRQLGGAWRALAAKGEHEEADELVEVFVLGATGEGESADAAVDAQWARGALAVRLAPVETAAQNAVFRKTGRFAATLVLRNPEGAEAVTAEDLAAWGFDEEEAFAAARENLTADVAESLDIEALGSEDPSEAVRVAPGDPVAASYALVPGLGDALRSRLGDEVRLHLLGPSVLVATRGDVEPPDAVWVADPLLDEPVAPGELAWPA